MLRRPAQVFTDPTDQRTAHRLGGALALGSVALSAVLAIGVSRWPVSTNLTLLPLLALMAAAGVAALLRPERMPAWLTVVTLVTGSAFISVGMVVVGRAGVDGADNEMLFLLPVLFAAYFCRPWLTGLVVATCSASYGAALLQLQAAQPGARWLTTSVSLWLVGALVTVVRSRDAQRLEHLAEQAGRDALTGLLNRRGLAAQAAREQQDVVSLLVLDLDHFKRVNDAHGHAVGDQVLGLVAAELRQGLRADDLVARLGGEEFALVLPGCDAGEAVERAEQLRVRVLQRSTHWPAPVTLSVGCATGDHGTDELAGLLDRADRALYAAKAAGRNTVRSQAATYDVA